MPYHAPMRALLESAWAWLLSVLLEEHGYAPEDLNW
jgi:hypothetical protein